MKLSQKVMNDLASMGLTRKTAETAPAPVDQSGMPATAPMPVPPQDPVAQAASMGAAGAPAGAMPAGAMPAGAPPDPSMQGGMPDPAMLAQLAGGMPPDPNMQGGMPVDPSVLAGMGAMPGMPGMPGMPPPPPPEEMTPPVEEDDAQVKRDEALQKALDDLGDKMSSILDRLDAIEREREGEREFSVLSDLSSPPKVDEAGEAAPADVTEESDRKTDRGGLFHRMLPGVFKG